MTSSEARVKRVTWLLLALALAATVWVVSRTARRPRAPLPAPDLLSAVPAGPALLVTADVGALGEATVAALLGESGASWLGLRRPCGFEPLLAVRQLAFVMPSAADGQSADFALLARTTLPQESVLGCAEALIRQRGGSAARASLGGFRSVRDQQKPLGEVAVRADGLVVLSGGQYFRDVIDAASGRFVPNPEALERASLHARVRQKLGSSQVVLSALPGSLLSLPGVTAWGIGLSLRQDVLLRGYVDCASPMACAEARNLLAQLLAMAAKEPGLAGLANVSVVQRQSTLEAAGNLPHEQLGKLVSQLLSP